MWSWEEPLASPAKLSCHQEIQMLAEAMGGPVSRQHLHVEGACIVRVCARAGMRSDLAAAACRLCVRGCVCV